MRATHFVPIGLTALVASPAWTWAAVGDLTETNVADPDYLVRPPDVDPGLESAAGWIAGVVLVAAIAAFVLGRRAGLLSVRQAWSVLPIVLLGAFVGMAGRVLTAGGVGANIGGGLVVMASPFIVLPLVAIAVILAFQRT